MRRDKKAQSALNLTVLKRRDKDVTSIVFSAGHVQMYSWDVQDNQWAQDEITGPLFIVSRTSEPQYQLNVLNRKGLNDFVQPITTDFEIDSKTLDTPNFVFYQDWIGDAKKVKGIWFFDDEEKGKFMELINESKRIKRQTLQDITTSQELDDGQPPVEQLTNPSISLHQQAKENILQDLFGQQPEKQQTQANGNSFFNAKPVSQTSLTRESVSATLHALAEDPTFLDMVCSAVARTSH